MLLFFGLVPAHDQIEAASISKGKTAEDLQAQQHLLLKQWFQAVKSGDIETIAKLIELVNINSKNKFGQTALLLASKYGHTSIVKLLLNAPLIDINAQSNTKNTALIMATAYGHTNIVKMLLSGSKIDINMQDQRGDTACMYACTRHEGKLLKLFLELPALDINLKNKSGFTALMYAAQIGAATAVEELLRVAHININLQDNNGSTALMLATINGHQKLVELLLQDSKLNINAQDNQFNTALILSKTWRQSLIYALIKSKIDELRQTAVEAIDEQKPELFQAVITQIGQETIIKSNILKYICAHKDHERYISAFLTKSRDEAKKRKISDNPAQTINCALCHTKNCILRCTACRLVYYCSKECQKADWREHKKLCKQELVSYI